MLARPSVEQLLAERQAWQKEREQLKIDNAVLRGQQESDRNEIDRLRAIIASLKHKLFGNRKGEVIDEVQLKLHLSGLEEALVELEAKEQAQELRQSEVSEESTSRPRRARFVFPKQVEEVTETLEPEEVLAEPQAYRKIGEDVSEQLDIVPMKFIRKRIVRPRYVRKGLKESAPIAAKLPERVIAGGLPSVRLLVHILLAKYVDHLPLYRISGIFKQRYGVHLSRQTMSDWVGSVAEDWLSLIYNSIKNDIKEQSFLHADETPITYQYATAKGRSGKGYLWIYVSSQGDVLYDWQTSRSQAAGAAILGGYRGLLQCDGYKVYPSLASSEGFELVGCMAHVRRKFYEAFELHAEDASAWYLLQIKSLYSSEKAIKEHGHEPVSYRNEHSRPVMETMYERLKRDQLVLEEQATSIKTLGAINYSLGQWEALLRYLDHPQASIDNNAAEQAIRPTKLGMKNWLFFGHPEAGKRSAIIYTLVQNCKNLGINPQTYLTDVLEKLPSAGSDSESARQLQPRYWKQYL